MYRFAFVLLICVSCQSALAGDVGRPPNLLIILTDDLGVNDLACYGRKDHRTPNLDRLAAQGVRFTSAYCAQPICSASRAALLTGKSPARLHLTTFLPGRPDCTAQRLKHPQIQQQLPLNEQTLAEWLKPAGYATACIGKWHLGGVGFGPQQQGFDFVHAGQANTVPTDTEGGKGEYDLTAAAETFIEQHRGEPWFVYLCHNTPHITYSARAELIAKHTDAFEPTYAAVIETLDDSVGRLLAKLDALKLTDQTIVLFTSDNGGLHVPEGTHPRITHNTPYRAGKGYLYEGGLRIPAIIRWPGKFAAGRVVDAPFVNTDWLPTVLELASRPVPAGLDGMSIAPLLLKDQDDVKQRTFHWHFPHYTNQGSRPAGAVRAGNWKLIEHYEDQRVELFDLSQDVAEAHDVASAKPELAARLRTSLKEWRTSVGAQLNEPNPRFDPAAHRVLYEVFDSTRFNPLTADTLEWDRVAAWRRAMNRAVSSK